MSYKPAMLKLDLGQLQLPFCMPFQLDQTVPFLQQQPQQTPRHYNCSCPEPILTKMYNKYKLQIAVLLIMYQNKKKCRSLEIYQ